MLAETLYIRQGSDSMVWTTPCTSTVRYKAGNGEISAELNVY